MRHLLISRHADALALRNRSGGNDLPVPASLALLTLHAAGILAVARFTLQPAWLALIPLLLVQPLALSLRTRRLRLMPEALAPLGLAYLVLLARLAIAFVWRLAGGYDGTNSVPDPWGDLLNLSVAAGVGTIWALVAQADITADALGRRLRARERVGWVLLVVAIGWGAIAHINLRGSGVTASDPYSYVQMAVDIARTGSPIHVFGLATEVDRWGVATWPAVPIGYRPPDPTTGSSASVWPPGYSALLAGAYLLGGESWLYLLTPLLGLAALVATWALCQELLHAWPARRRRLAAGLAALILATSYEQVVHAAIPMADLAAQLFSVLAVCFAWRTHRRPSAVAATLTGLFLGLAFAMRHTQLLLALPVLVAWIPLPKTKVAPEPKGSATESTAGSAGVSPAREEGQTASLRPRGRSTAGSAGVSPARGFADTLTSKGPASGLETRGQDGRAPGRAVPAREVRALPPIGLLPALACSGLAALLVASPVLWYNAVAFGSPFAVGSSELGLFGWQHVPDSLAAIGAESLRPNEFLYLVPFIALGAIRLRRTSRWVAAVLFTWLLALLAFHLPYAALRMRDLLPELPAIAILSGVEMADLLDRARASGRGDLRSRLLAVAAASIFVLLWLRTVSTLQLAAPGDDFTTFGYLNRAQRASFARLADLTPPGSVVAASLNSGAVSLYAGRDSVRPAYWSPEEWEALLAHAPGAGRPIFLLDDGAEMALPLELARSRHQVSPVASLPLPYFTQGSLSEPRDVQLYAVTP